MLQVWIGCVLLVLGMLLLFKFPPLGGLVRRHAAEFEGVQRRLQINQYR